MNAEQLFDTLILSLNDFTYEDLNINKNEEYGSPLGTIKKAEATVMLAYNLTLENPDLLKRVVQEVHVYHHLYCLLRLYLKEEYADYRYDTTEDPDSIDEYISDWLLQEDDDTYAGNMCYDIYCSTKNVLKRMINLSQ